MGNGKTLIAGELVVLSNFIGSPIGVILDTIFYDANIKYNVLLNISYELWYSFNVQHEGRVLVRERHYDGMLVRLVSGDFLLPILFFHFLSLPPSVNKILI